MAALISENERIARKNYNCDACRIIIAHFGSFNDFVSSIENITFAEKRLLVNAKQNNYQIQKGEKYIRQYIKDSEFEKPFEYLAIPEIHKICLKYDFYEE